MLYAQNHGGVYRSDDAGDTWTSIAEGLPAEFGFPVVAHPRVDGTVWVFPLESSYRRFPPTGPAGSGGPPTAARPGPSRARACPTAASSPG